MKALVGPSTLALVGVFALFAGSCTGRRPVGRLGPLEILTIPGNGVELHDAGILLELPEQSDDKTWELLKDGELQETEDLVGQTEVEAVYYETGKECESADDCEAGGNCIQVTCESGSCILYASPGGTQCDLPCEVVSMCTDTGECVGVVHLECPEDGNPCTWASCDETSGACVEHFVPDGTPTPASTSNCWVTSVCSGGKPQLVEGMKTALASECEAMTSALYPLGCIQEYLCEEGNPACVVVNRIDGSPCMGPGDGAGPICPGHSCLEGLCVANGSLDYECGQADFPPTCGAECKACTGLTCHWQSTSEGAKTLLPYCQVLPKEGEPCDDGNFCTSGEQCLAGSWYEGPYGQEALGFCGGAMYVPPAGAQSDLVLDGEDLVLSGKQIFGSVKLTNGASLHVTPYDGAACQPMTSTSGTGTLVIEANHVFIDSTSSIVADGAGGGGKGCGEWNYAKVNDSGPGGGYGGAGGPGGTHLLAPGLPYGTADEDDIDMGSDGATVSLTLPGCGSAGTTPGGWGGGMVIINCCLLELHGTISANGADGTNGGPLPAEYDGGGGGSGGGVLLDCHEVVHDGIVRANGGAGGNGKVAATCYGFGGGGGGGGRVKIFAEVYAGAGKIETNGGLPGTGTASPGGGAPGTIHLP